MDLPNPEGRVRLDIMLVSTERQKQNWAFERKLKAAEAPMVRKDVLPSAGDTFVEVVGDDNDDVDLSPHIVKGRLQSQKTASFAPSV